MKDITVRICTGTTCFVMGAGQLQDLADRLPSHLAECVRVEGARCLELCKDRQYGRAPYVMIDDEVVAEATTEKVIEMLEKALAR